MFYKEGTSIQMAVDIESEVKPKAENRLELDNKSKTEPEVWHEITNHNRSHSLQEMQELISGFLTEFFPCSFCNFHHKPLNSSCKNIT